MFAYQDSVCKPYSLSYHKTRGLSSPRVRHVQVSSLVRCGCLWLFVPCPQLPPSVFPRVPNSSLFSSGWPAQGLPCYRSGRPAFLPPPAMSGSCQTPRVCHSRVTPPKRTLTSLPLPAPTAYTSLRAFNLSRMHIICAVVFDYHHAALPKRLEPTVESTLCGAVRRRKSDVTNQVFLYLAMEGT